MNCLLQWAIVLGVLLLINRRLVPRSPKVDVPNSTTPDIGL
jgi:hypothetical protein